jgi:hypothetical protein
MNGIKERKKGSDGDEGYERNGFPVNFNGLSDNDDTIR